MVNRIFSGLAVLATVMMMCSTASAQGMTVAQVGAKLEESGLSVEISGEGEGGAIYSETQGFNFALIAFNCETSQQRCRDYLFSAYFETDGKLPASAANDYNENSLAGRAYIDSEGDATLEHFFSVDDGDDDLVEHNLGIWQSILPDLAAFIGSYGETPTS